MVFWRGTVGKGLNKQREFMCSGGGTVGKGLKKQREFIVFWRGYSGEGVKKAKGIHCVLEGVQWGRR